VLGGNPVYTAPVDLKFGDAMQKVGVRAHLGLYEDETAALSHWHIPETHFLEAWSDVRSDDGTVSIVQPLIAPLYNGKSAHEVLAAITQEGERSGYDLVRQYWIDQGLVPGGRPREAEDAANRAPVRTAPAPAASAGAGRGVVPAQNQSSGRPPVVRAGGPAAPAQGTAAQTTPERGPATFTPAPAPRSWPRGCAARATRSAGRVQRGEGRMPRAMATVTAAVRSLTSSFSKMRVTWLFTVASLMNSVRPMSGLDRSNFRE